jgi:hypothetical protein
MRHDPATSILFGPCPNFERGSRRAATGSQSLQPTSRTALVARNIYVIAFDIVCGYHITV